MNKSVLRRLRSGDKVMGYERREGDSVWYSRNLSAWTGGKPVFDQTDRCTDYRDKNRRLLFENDIIRIKNKNEELVLEIIYDEMVEKFFLKDFMGEDIYPEELLEENQFTGKMEWYSYTFIQNL